MTLTDETRVALRNLAGALTPSPGNGGRVPVFLLQGVIESVEGETCTVRIQGAATPVRRVRKLTSSDVEAGDTVYLIDGGPSQRFVLGGVNGEWGGGGAGGSSSTLNGLTDVDTTGVTDGQALVWDAGAVQWMPVTMATVGDILAIEAALDALDADVVHKIEHGGTFGKSSIPPGLDDLYIDIDSPWGIDPVDGVYYDPGAVTAGEEAIMQVETGEVGWLLVSEII